MTAYKYIKNHYSVRCLSVRAGVDSANSRVKVGLVSVQLIRRGRLKMCMESRA